MAYSFQFQRHHDLNWYFIDEYNRICHVASAGGILPKIISENSENNDSYNQIVIDLPEIFKITINGNLDDIKNFKEDGDRANYLRDFESMARKGLYTFDKFDINNYEDNRYFLVAKPNYKGGVTQYPIHFTNNELITRIDGAIDKNNFTPFELLDLF